MPAPGGAVTTSDWLPANVSFTSFAMSEAGSELLFVIISCRVMMQSYRKYLTVGNMSLIICNFTPNYVNTFKPL